MDEKVLVTAVTALILPTILIMMLMVNSGVQNAGRDILYQPMDNELSPVGANATALSLGHSCLNSEYGLVFNVSGLTRGAACDIATNYTVDWAAGTITWCAHGTNLVNNSRYDVDYEYLDSGQCTTLNSFDTNNNSAYDLAAIVPIVLIGMTILVAIIGAVAFFASR